MTLAFYGVAFLAFGGAFALIQDIGLKIELFADIAEIYDKLRIGIYGRSSIA